MRAVTAPPIPMWQNLSRISRSLRCQTGFRDLKFHILRKFRIYGKIRSQSCWTGPWLGDAAMRQELLRVWNWLDSMRPLPVEVPQMQFDVEELDDGGLRFTVEGLKVWVYKGARNWVAQGLDIGYAASGNTIDEAKKNFERGLFATLEVNWKKNRSVETVLRPADPVIWIRWRRWIRDNQKPKFDRSDDSDGDLFSNSDFHPVFIT